MFRIWLRRSIIRSQFDDVFLVLNLRVLVPACCCVRFSDTNWRTVFVKLIFFTSVLHTRKVLNIYFFHYAPMLRGICPGSTRELPGHMSAYWSGNATWISDRCTYERVSKSFRTESITKYMLTKINIGSKAAQRVMAAKLIRLTHKIAIQLHLVAKSCTICSSHSRWPVRKLLDTPSYT
jgi:hypothetical protein